MGRRARLLVRKCEWVSTLDRRVEFADASWGPPAGLRGLWERRGRKNKGGGGVRGGGSWEQQVEVEPNYLCTPYDSHPYLLRWPRAAMVWW
jgi:hypothetical protein